MHLRTPDGLFHCDFLEHENPRNRLPGHIEEVGAPDVHGHDVAFFYDLCASARTFRASMVDPFERRSLATGRSNSVARKGGVTYGACCMAEWPCCGTQDTKMLRLVDRCLYEYKAWKEGELPSEKHTSCGFQGNQQGQ